MTGQQIALVGGGATELVGVALASLDIWLDQARTSAASLRRKGRELASRSWWWVETRILRRRQMHVVSSTATMPFETDGPAGVVKSVPEDALAEDQLRVLRELSSRCRSD